MARKIKSDAVSAALSALNDNQKAQLALIVAWTPQYAKGVVSYYRLDKRSTNALERLGLVTTHTTPVEGCKMTSLGSLVAAVNATMGRRR